MKRSKKGRTQRTTTQRKAQASDAERKPPLATFMPPVTAHEAEAKPLPLALSPKLVQGQLVGVLASLGDLQIKLPPDILVPALGGASDSEVPGAPDEPIYNAKQRANIQGNIIPGFNKDHQQFLFFRIRNVRRTKLWLRWITPFISSMDDVLAWVRAYRAMRLRLGSEPPMCAAWVNIAFSHRALAQLVSPADADGFHDQSFRQGLAARSTYLGDPSDKRREGHRSRWLVGGPRNEADIVVIVAADDPADLARLVREIKTRAALAQLVPRHRDNDWLAVVARARARARLWEATFGDTGPIRGDERVRTRAPRCLQGCD